jgi:tetratricopeptide (TPR) repeat protein
MDRLEALKNLIEQNPNDSFARYGLAQAYGNAGRTEEAVAEYRKLLEQNPKYAAAYFHAGQALEKLGRTEEARATYRTGIQVTTDLGDHHTRSELQSVLDMLA